jgi:RNA polymerase sigma factor (sigma-70 family)
MGETLGSEHPRSVPHDVRRLLEAADGPALEQAWTEFLQSYSRLILYVARQKTRDADGVMDRYAYVVERLREQDCRRLRAFTADGRGKFTTWLTVVVRRLCLDHDRHKYGRSGHTEAPSAVVFDRSSDGVVGSAVLDSLPDPTPLVDQALERDEVLQLLNAAITTLSPGDQLLLVLRYQDERSAREIASILSLATPFHVYRRLSRIHNALREALGALRDPEIREISAATHSAAVQYRWRRTQRFEPTP